MNKAPVASLLALLAVVGFGCSKKTSAPTCQAGLTLCGSACADLQLDAHNCGACGTACPGDRLCTAGACTISCGTDRIVCGNFCVAYLTDSFNCGACGNACASGFACEAGKCQIQCSAPTSRCGSETAGACLDLQTDSANCGACGNVCATGTACELGTCQVQCVAPQVRCGSAPGTCVTLDTTAHCGNCQVACDAGAACRYALCTTVSPACSGLLLPGAPLSPAAIAPVAIGAGPFDADAFTDLLIADASPAAGARLLLLSGRGDGTFSAPIVLEALTSPTGLLVGDLDGEGTTAPADVIVASGHAGVSTLQPLFGDGSGGFKAVQPDTSLSTGASPQALALVDLNLDGLPDLVVGDGSAQATANLSVFLNDPLAAGTFGVSAGTGSPRAPSQVLDVGAGVRAIATGDVNGDGVPDVVVVWTPMAIANTDPRCPAGTAQPCWLIGEVLLNDGAGRLTRPTYPSVGGAPTHQMVVSGAIDPGALAVADLDGDTLADWAVADATNNLVVFFKAAWMDPTHPMAGWPGFQWAIGSVSGPQALFFQDLDGDLRPDLVTVNGTAGALYFHHNAGPLAGGVAFDAPVPLPVGIAPAATVLAPAAVAGPSFFFTANAGTHDVAATQLVGAGAFDAPALYRAGSGTGALALGLLDGDGRLDLATADVLNDQITVRLQSHVGGTAGTFGPPTTLSLPSASAPVSIVAEKIDADSSTDLAVALEGTAQVAVLWGDGTGGFSAPSLLQVGASPEQVIAVDLDGDALPDLVTADMGAGQVTVLRHQSGTTFAAGVAYPVGAGPRSVAALKLTAGSTCADLVTANATAGTLTILPCNAAIPGTFKAPVTVPACPGAKSLAVADFDSNGSPDVAVACDAGIAIFRGPGDGTLAGGVLFDAGGAPRTITAADVNGDGRPDLLASVPGKGGLTVLHGAAGLAFSPPRVYPVGGEPFATVAARLFVHADGRSDVCAAVGTPLGALLGAGAVVMQSGCLP